MKEFSAQTGPWIGQSNQEGLRLSEHLELTIRGNTFSGFGTDVDGEFEIMGDFEPEDSMVSMVRTYVFSPKNPSQVGYPFIYVGRWNGDFVTGRWMMSSYPSIGDHFEMWPESPEELSLSNIIDSEEPIVV